mmetsp:Transcript_24835/g.38549  ORF Transcript_24835/g.38549 Transcript_24835/m.38549 type:complete len:204 (-) Transcript_24835:1520-2131(-)
MLPCIIILAEHIRLRLDEFRGCLGVNHHCTKSFLNLSNTFKIFSIAQIDVADAFTIVIFALLFAITSPNGDNLVNLGILLQRFCSLACVLALLATHNRNDLIHLLRKHCQTSSYRSIKRIRGDGTFPNLWLCSCNFGITLTQVLVHWTDSINIFPPVLGTKHTTMNNAECRIIVLHAKRSKESLANIIVLGNLGPKDNLKSNM